MEIIKQPIYLLKDTEIGLPCSPCTRVKSKTKVHDAFRIEMTCGGGMGGAHWNEYVSYMEPTGGVILDGFVTVKSFPDGKQKSINPRYIVKTELVKIIEQHFLTSNSHIVNCEGAEIVRYIVNIDNMKVSYDEHYDNRNYNVTL